MRYVLLGLVALLAASCSRGSSSTFSHDAGFFDISTPTASPASIPDGKGRVAGQAWEDPKCIYLTATPCMAPSRVLPIHVSLSQSGAPVASADAVKPRFVYSIDVAPGIYQISVSGAPSGDSCPKPEEIILGAEELTVATIHCLS
jgi:hypothetical protein